MNVCGTEAVVTQLIRGGVRKVETPGGAMRQVALASLGCPR